MQNNFGKKHIDKKYLEKLYRQYTQQIKKDYALRDNVAKRLQVFAPFKAGDKVKYMPKWMFGGGYNVTEFKRFGIVVSCEYEPEEDMGKWRVRVCPTTKDFKEHGRNTGHEWLGVKHVRKIK